MIRSSRRAAMFLFLAAVGCTGPAKPGGKPLVVANDNRTPAGHAAGDTLYIRLVLQQATWRAEADSGPSPMVPAFAEEGKAPQIPAPLIRVRTGSTIIASVRNALPDSAIVVRGLATHPSQQSDSIVLRPGDSATVRFAAGAPGTYLYGASSGKYKDDERESAGGAFVVDSLGPIPADRILVLNIWGHQIDSTNYSNALAINGRSWPYDERIRAIVGDTVRWRVINATGREHPMHLHGFYFEVESRGTPFQDSVYAPGARRMAVTESMDPFTTMSMNYVPDRPGDWLFHCHIAFHVIPEAAKLTPLPATSHDRMSHDPRVHMAGLILGITVAAPAGWHEPPRPAARQLHLFIQEGKPKQRPAARSLAFVLQEGSTPPAHDSVTRASSALILTRDEPTDITVINRLPEAGAVHWHGIELESWSDGVAGWSGLDSTRTAPPIQPGDSFVAHLTLPRAGTFIYHTHMNDLEQLTSGLYGAIVVLEPGHRFDPLTDHVFVSGWGSTGPVVNGDSTDASTMQVQAGTVQRLRFVNIGAAGAVVIALRKDTTAVIWRALAKDGADLPGSQATARPATFGIDVGETADFEWTPAPGTYRLAIGPDPAKPTYIRTIVVTRPHQTGRAP